MESRVAVQVDDAQAFITEWLRAPRPGNGYSTFGYELYLPNVIVAFIRDVERSTDHDSRLFNGPRATELSPHFYEAAWNLCRLGVLRPSVQRLGSQATTDGGGGNGYSVTSAGRKWLDSDASGAMLGPGRASQLIGKLAPRLGAGFSQRANEAITCHNFGAYLACCAMCGAAAESILLAIAIEKSGDETAVLAKYHASKGRRRTIDDIVGGSIPAISEPFKSAMSLLSKWRDGAAHGLWSTISEIEAHEAVARLIRFAQFAVDNWEVLTVNLRTDLR